MELDKIRLAELNTAQLEQVKEAEKLLNARENSELYLLAFKKNG